MIFFLEIDLFFFFLAERCLSICGELLTKRTTRKVYRLKALKHATGKQTITLPLFFKNFFTQKCAIPRGLSHPASILSKRATTPHLVTMKCPPRSFFFKKTLTAQATFVATNYPISPPNPQLFFLPKSTNYLHHMLVQASTKKTLLSPEKIGKGILAG